MEAAVRFPGTGDRFLLVDVIDQSVTLNHIHERDRGSIRYFSVARYGRLPNFGAFDYSKTDPNIVALGLVSGSACLINLREDDKPSETIATFKLKQQRKCNSIALSTQNQLAVALDKTRSDVCLNIFDANADQNQEPVRRLCPAEVVSSVRFFPSQPQELVVAAQRSCIRLYDLRDGYFSNSNNTQVSTRNVNNIAIDPLDENYFTAAGSSDDPSVSVWDKRWIQNNSGASTGGAVFEFKPAVDNTSRTTIWSLRYSGQQRGRLAISSNRGELRVVDMVEGPELPLNPTEYLPTHTHTHSNSSWASNHYVSQTRLAQRPIDSTQEETVDTSRLIAFDWIPGQVQSAEQCILALRPNRKIEVIRVPCTITQATITARNDFSLAFDDVSILETKARAELAKPQAPYEQQRTAEDFGPYSGEAVPDDDDEVKIVCEPDAPQLANMLASSALFRDRCRRGYLFDCNRNAEIAKGNWQLERLWEIINRFREQAADGGMVAESLDLGYIGVAAICQEKPGNVARRTVSLSPAKMEDAIYALNISRELPSFEGARTDFPEHRQLSLELCGWRFHPDTLENECQELIERGLFYQAVVQAVLHGYKHLALNILRQLIRSKTLPNIGLGALLASDGLNEDQKEMCLWMAADTEDPALKALLTFLTTGNWRDVMKTQYLHMGYKIALGLKYLNDTELKGFIQSETARAVKNGDLEGILLTGLGEDSMDLFATYIAKTNDLQTAVIATAFTNPLYVDDIRWEMWKDTYFMQLQSWRAFTERARFVIQHSRIAQTKDGHSLLDAPPGQAKLQCNHCQQPLARHDGRSIHPGPPPVAANSKVVTGPAASAGIVCPRCGRHMPRCGICRMWLGTPDPSRRAGAKELQQMNDVMAKFLTFCVSCQHGFHADHARSWFEKHSTCPVPDCTCLCLVR